MPTEELGLVQGTLDLLVLRTLAWGPQHGYGIAGWIRSASSEALIVEDRALYLSLHRLDAQGLLRSEWGISENNRKAKFYRITAAGRQELRARTSHWERYAAAVFQVLRAARDGARA